MKARVPSIGSMIQQNSAFGSHRPEFLPDDAVFWVKVGEGGPDRGLGGEVGGGDRIQRRAALVINF